METVPKLQPKGLPSEEAIGKPRLRQFTEEEIQEFLEADKLDPETERKVKDLLNHKE
jgi:hypothetical protein